MVEGLDEQIERLRAEGRIGVYEEDKGLNFLLAVAFVLSIVFVNVVIIFR